MHKQAVLSLLFGLFIFVGIGFSFTPVNLGTILGNVDVISVLTSENIFQMYPVYVKVVNPSLSGAGNNISGTCFSVAGCDLNKVYFLISSEGSKKKVPQQIFSNAANGKISLISEFSGIIYVNKKDILSRTSTHFYLALAGQDTTSEKTITTGQYKWSLKFDNWSYHNKADMDSHFSKFISDYFCELDDDGNPFCPSGSQNYLGFLLPADQLITYCGELSYNNTMYYLFAKQGQCPEDISIQTIKVSYGKELVCNSDCTDFSEDCECTPLASYYTSFILVYNIPDSFKSQFTYGPLLFVPLTQDLCDNYAVNVKLKNPNGLILEEITQNLDDSEIPYGLQYGNYSMPLKLKNGKAVLFEDPNVTYSIEAYFPYDNLEFSFGAKFGATDDDIGTQNIELNNPDFKIICTYNYPSLEIQLK
ncbi:MAG: hypothetical protein PHH82_00180 [Candidatus ainarchaeum sp.]|nr:hypothetical protein [Candidatus ainarchaeum sp.]